MAKFISTAISNKYPPITGDGAGELLNAKYTVAVSSALALGDLILFGKLPAGHEPVDGNTFASDIDTGGAPVVAFTVGILNDAGTDLVSGTDFITATTVGTAGTLARFDKQTGLNLAPQTGYATTDIGTGGTVSAVNGNAYVHNGDRVLAAKVTTAAQTPAAGTVGISITYKPQ
jgi:hypothetical protein